MKFANTVLLSILITTAICTPFILNNFHVTGKVTQVESCIGSLFKSSCIVYAEFEDGTNVKFNIDNHVGLNYDVYKRCDGDVDNCHYSNKTSIFWYRTYQLHLKAQQYNTAKEQ